MNFLYSLIVVIPLGILLYMAYSSKKYVRDISDYLASGRVAGRYVIAVGDLTAGLSVITLVGTCEGNYQSGFAYGFWGGIATVLSIILSMTGYCVYRFRETKCLSCGQFFEMRYSRPFRIVASIVRALAEMFTNALGPAVAVRFFIYFLGLPHKFTVFGITLPTYAIMVTLCLLLALAIIWPAGRISLLITDSIQGILSYPIFVVFGIFIIVNISWFADVVPVMADRIPGESFINPFDIEKLEDFNLFSTVVLILGATLNRAAWIGNDTTNAGRNAHEQKMAGVLGAVRNGYSGLMMTLIGAFVITFMAANRFESQAQKVRLDLCEKAAQEIFVEPQDTVLISRITDSIAALPLPNHIIDTEKLFDHTVIPETGKTVSDTYREATSYSKKNSRDMEVLNAAKNQIARHYFNDENFTQEHLQELFDDTAKIQDPEIKALAGKVNAKTQAFKSLYFQMMMPTMLHHVFPPALTALFTLLMIMLLISTDDSRIFNASSSLIQDVILPFRKTPLTMEQHLKYLKVCTLAVTVFFFVVSLFFSQMDFINMFVTIMCAVWLGAAAPIMLGGLYTSFGNTAGAWAALVVGSGISTSSLFGQRYWQDTIYPWICSHEGWAAGLDNFLRTVSAPFNPWVHWELGNGEKFPINSYEVYLIAMIMGILAYVIFSFIFYRKPYNMDRLLHRGIYSEDPEEYARIEAEKAAIKAENRKGNIFVRFFRWSAYVFFSVLGITPEYTLGDKLIAWAVFLYSIVWSFVLCFFGTLLWNSISPWQIEVWGRYYYITTVFVPMTLGIVSTVWFMVGGIIDMKALFRDLARKTSDALDNGMVEGEVSLSDKAKFEKLEKQSEDNK